MNKIKYNDLAAVWKELKTPTLSKISKFLESGNYVDSEPVKSFERAFARYHNSYFSVMCGSGMNALEILHQAIFEIHEVSKKQKIAVVIPNHTFVANALPAFHFPLDISLHLIETDQYYQMSPHALEFWLQKNKAFYDLIIISAVHLYGHPCNIERICEIADMHDVVVIEDASQAHGAKVYYKGGAAPKLVGTFAPSIFSLYPGKNLGGFGEAGIINFPNHYVLKDICEALRNYGTTNKIDYNYIGWNSRPDSVQAIFLEEKLKFLSEHNIRRNQIAGMYHRLIKNQLITLPKTADYVVQHAYHCFVIQCAQRDKLQNYLQEVNVPTLVHYRQAIQDNVAFQYKLHVEGDQASRLADVILSLPIHPYLTDEQVVYICDMINNFKG